MTKLVRRIPYTIPRQREQLDQLLAETFGRRLLPDDLVGRLALQPRPRRRGAERWAVLR